jgi:hypothetical protein
LQVLCTVFLNPATENLYGPTAWLRLQPAVAPTQQQESAMATWQIIVVVLLAAAVAGLLVLRSRQQQ